eukprot:scaffold39479_cov244-Amphora_coffeaeformis.AAC.1
MAYIQNLEESECISITRQRQRSSTVGVVAILQTIWAIQGAFGVVMLQGTMGVGDFNAKLSKASQAVGHTSRSDRHVQVNKGWKEILRLSSLSSNMKRLLLSDVSSCHQIDLGYYLASLSINSHGKLWRLLVLDVRVILLWLFYCIHQIMAQLARIGEKINGFVGSLEQGRGTLNGVRGHSDGHVPARTLEQ